MIGIKAMTNEKITSTALFNDTQIQHLPALLDTILPASTDGAMPSAGEFDFPAYISEQAPDFAPALGEIVDHFDGEFADRPLTDRVALVQEFASADAKAFNDLLFHIYNCYYQDDRVRALIGVMPGAPFPRGNLIPSGDLSLLDGLAERSRGYRR